MSFRFEILNLDGRARRGVLHTEHGEVATPAFMPVGTQGTVKAMSVDALLRTGSEIILGNTYHLHLRPGDERILALGGLHAFSGWHGPMLTDSGGFQVYSLANPRHIDDVGVRLQSHLDGRALHFTPELAMQIQANLGADIVMAFDDCPALPADATRLAAAVDRTMHWARRCVAQFGARRRHAAGHEQVLFGIVQGGLDAAERQRCAQQLIELDLPGYAIGGLSVGEDKADLHRVAAATAQQLPHAKPRYLMGVGFPDDILAAVAAGVDMFDCVLPTRMARNGTLLTADGRLVLRNARYADDVRPVEADCDCSACRRHSRAYLRHLIVAREILGLSLCSEHNLRFYQRLMTATRDAIAAGCFAQFRREFLARWQADGQLAAE